MNCTNKRLEVHFEMVTPTYWAPPWYLEVTFYALAAQLGDDHGVHVEVTPLGDELGGGPYLYAFDVVFCGGGMTPAEAEEIVGTLADAELEAAGVVWLGVETTEVEVG